MRDLRVHRERFANATSGEPRIVRDPARDQT